MKEEIDLEQENLSSAAIIVKFFVFICHQKLTISVEYNESFIVVKMWHFFYALAEKFLRKICQFFFECLLISKAVINAIMCDFGECCVRTQFQWICNCWTVRKYIHTLNMNTKIIMHTHQVKFMYSFSACLLLTMTIVVLVV